MYQNVRGLNTKLINLFNDSFNLNHHVLIFTETWLKDNVFDHEILCGKFQIFRCDRPLRIGGGVLIAVSSDLHAELVTSSLNIEFVSVLVKLNMKNFYITCSYIPPNSNQSLYFDHIEAVKTVLSSSNSQDSICVTGDFNLPFINWDKDPDSSNLLPICSNSWTDSFFNALSDLCLFQLNNIRNINGKLLDLIFVNDPSDFVINRSLPITLPEDRHHPTLELTCSLESLFLIKYNRRVDKVYNFKSTNYLELNQQLREINWNNVLLNNCLTPVSLDIMVNNFYLTLYSIMDRCIKKHVPYTHSGPPWSSRQLSSLKNSKNKYYKKYKQTCSPADYNRYSVFRAEYNLLNKQLYNNYLIKLKTNFKNDPKSFYKFVNSKRKTVGFPSTMKYGANDSSDDVVICNMFADFFATTYSNIQYDDRSLYPFQILCHDFISMPLINSATITSNLKQLKSSFFSGPDSVPSCILLNCADALAKPLRMLFNASIKLGYFPKLWKKSYIIPLFKSGSKSNILNYRGIAKLSSIPKLLEKCITESLSHSILPLLSSYQHGFRKGCSTSTNLLEFTSLIVHGFVQGKITDTVYTDFSKAFDRVNHKLLIKKLHLMGFSQCGLNWIKSYLTGRTQVVRFKNKASKNIDVLSGVPQGSHLGPILFSLFINDLPSSIKHCNILMYADDVKIFRSSNQLSEFMLFQSDLDSFYVWCVTNLMDLNFNKCKQMRFSRKNFDQFNYSLGGHRLEILNSYQDLGILLDQKLNFISHINMTVTKARGVLAFIKRWAKEFTDPYTTKQLYTSLVRPILEYGSVVWDPIYNVHVNNIESVQKQFLLFSLRSLPWNPAVNLPSYTSRLALIKLPTLQSRRTMLNVTFLFNLLNGDIRSEFLVNSLSFNVPVRPSRYFVFLSLRYFRENYANAEPFRKICSDFNKLYSLIDFSLNVNSIKQNVINFLNS